MPHAVEMPSFLSDDTGQMLSQNRHPLDLSSHLRRSHEKANGNVRTSSHTSAKGNLGEGSDIYADSGSNGRLQANGDIPPDTNLNTLPNGRSSASSWEHKSSRNGSNLSVNGGINGVSENGRRSPALLEMRILLVP